jgi:hypothetical protein
MPFQRFTNRETRIQRREERNMFRRRLLPLAWVAAGFGAFGLAGCGLYLLVEGEWPWQVAGLFIALVVLPLVLGFVGLLRGHRSKHLEVP